MHSPLKFRHLRTLLEVAHTTRITKAAINLNISQPAISRLISTLEKSFGVPLFERTHERMEPSVYGKIIITSATRAFAHIKNAEEEIRATLRLGRSAIDGRLSRNPVDHELHAVIAIAKFQNATSAAKNLTISQTALKRSLSSIERRLSLRLFERTSKFMIPTTAGEIIARQAQLAFHEIQQAHDELFFILGDKSHSLKIRIGALPLSRVHLVPCAISQLVHDIPDIDITIVDGLYENLLRDLCSGEIDLIVGSIRGGLLPTSVTTEKLFDDSLAVVACSDHPIFRLPRVSIDDLRTSKWILPRKGAPLREHFDDLLRANGLPTPRTVIEVDSLTAIRSFLLTDDWLAVVSRSQVYYDELQNILKIVSVFPASVIRPVGLTLRKDYVPSRSVQLLIKHLRSVAVEMMQLPAAS